MKKLLFFGMITGILFMASCKKDSLNSNVDVVFKSSKPAVMKSTAVSAIDLTDVIVNIRKIEFEIDEEYEDEGNQQDSTDTEFQLNGPFLVNLLSDGNLLSETVGTVDLPNTGYDEIKSKLDVTEGLTTDDPMYNRSLYIAGTMDAVPFEIWYDDEVELKTEFPDTSAIVLDGTSIKMYIDLHVDQVISGLMQLNLANAVDGNQDGTIQIGPNDPDGNADFIEMIIHRFEESFDLDDDDNNENDD